MTKQTTAERDVNLNMGFCLDLPQAAQVSIDCETCHYLMRFAVGDLPRYGNCGLWNGVTFIKISALSGVVAATLESCGSPEHQLIRFIPDEDLIPGIATWKPSVCTLCSAGCGLLVRVMQGDAEVVRNGKLGLIKMGLAKKLEGNPQHPVNLGKLCARGQAGLAGGLPSRPD